MTETRILELQPSAWMQMKVNPSAQRQALRMSAVHSIVKDFDHNHLGVIHCSLRDGILYVIDGWHRLSALKILKWDKPIMVRVTTGLDVKAEAQHFLSLNKTTPVSTLDAFQVRVTAGDSLAAGVKSVLGSNALAVGRETTAIRALEKAFNQLGEEGLDRLIKIAVKAWLGEPRFLQAPIIDALRRIIVKHSSFDSEHMAKSLGTITPSTALARAVQRRDVDGGSTADALVHQFINLYNKGKRVGRIEVAA